jgi:hypothetical protein
MKIWHTVNISTEEQDISLSSTEDMTAIIVEAKELDGTPASRIYLTDHEMEFLILKMREMMKYIKE